VKYPAIFTKTGMPIPVIRLNTDALIQASAFCCGRALAFIEVPKMRVSGWITNST
jgi:hypothetical protein